MTDLTHHCDAERLRGDLAELRDPVNITSLIRANGELPGSLHERLTRERGWTNERLARAFDALAHDRCGDVRLSKDEHRKLLATRGTRTASAGAGVSATRSRPSSHPNLERPGTAGQHIAAARAAGYDPTELWPSLRGLVASAGPDRPAKPDQAGSKPRNPRPPATSPLDPIRSSAGRSEALRGRGLDARHDKAVRQVQANRANPRSGKNEPSQAADRGRPVVRPRGERRSR